MSILARSALAVVVLCAVMSARRAEAATIIFEGTFTEDNGLALIGFTVDSPTLFTARTTSYDALDGFDPLLTLFDGTLIGGAGNFIADNDDEDPGGIFDSLLQRLLSAGSYTLAVTQSPNYYEPQFGQFGYTDQPCFFPPDDPAVPCDTFLGRTGAFAGQITLEPQVVPEPATLLLVTLGAAALGRRHRHGFSRRA